MSQRASRYVSPAHPAIAVPPEESRSASTEGAGGVALIRGRALVVVGGVGKLVNHGWRTSAVVGAGDIVLTDALWNGGSESDFVRLVGVARLKIANVREKALTPEDHDLASHLVDVLLQQRAGFAMAEGDDLARATLALGVLSGCLPGPQVREPLTIRPSQAMLASLANCSRETIAERFTTWRGVWGLYILHAMATRALANRAASQMSSARGV